MATRTKAKTDDITQVDLEIHPNEASDLLPVASKRVLKAHKWDMGFYTVLDEGTIEQCVAVAGHRKGAEPGEGWEVHRLQANAGRGRGKTEDAEACALKDGWVYLIGSHYGSKAGPLEARRAWIARFREDELAGHLGESPATLDIARNRFMLHRAINDALAASDVDVLPVGDVVRKRFIERTIKRGKEKRKSWAGRIRPSDTPLNIEAAAFRESGSLLLGLRVPCTAGGHPILVELNDVESMFDNEHDLPHIGGVWTIANVGSRRSLRGFRALHNAGGDHFDAIFGSLDALGKNSSLLEDHPAGAGAMSEHWRFDLPADSTGGELEGRRVYKFKDERTVEGVSRGPDGQTYYVVDADSRVDLRFLLVD